jgi:hypothetical protein
VNGARNLHGICGNWCDIRWYCVLVVDTDFLQRPSHSANRVHVVVNPALGAGESFQNDAETSGRNTKATRRSQAPIRMRESQASEFVLFVRRGFAQNWPAKRS